MLKASRWYGRWTTNVVAYYAFELAEGRTDELIKLFRAQRKEVEVWGNQITIRFPEEGFTCGLVTGGSPVDHAQSLMFALYGPWWALGMNNAYERAQKIIAEELKRRKKIQRRKRMKRTKKPPEAEPVRKVRRTKPAKGKDAEEEESEGSL